MASSIFSYILNVDSSINHDTLNYPKVNKLSAKRLTKIRNALKITSKGYKEESFDNLTETQENLQLKTEYLIVLSHRNFAQAISMRQSIMADESLSYKRPHLIRKLSKALLWSTRLHSLLKESDNKKFAKESKALKDSIKALLFSEKKKYKESLPFFVSAIEGLNDLLSSEETVQIQKAISARILFLLPFVDFCSYAVEVENPLTGAKIEEIEENLGRVSKNVFDDFSSNFNIFGGKSSKDSFDEFLKKSEDSGVLKVELPGFKLDVKKRCNRMFLLYLGRKQAEFEKLFAESFFVQKIESIVDIDPILAVFMTIFSAFDQLNGISEGREGEMLAEYLNFRKSEFLLMRDFLLSEKMRVEYSLNAMREASEEKVYAYDISVLYDKIIKSLVTVAERITEFSQESSDGSKFFGLIEILNFRVSYFEIFRDFYIAECYSNTSKTEESVSILYDVLGRVEEVKNIVDKYEQKLVIQKKNIISLENDIKSKIARSLAEKVLMEENEAGIGEKRPSKVCDGRPLIERIVDNEDALVTPPKFHLIAPRPIFFDIALDYVKVPKIKVESK